MANETINGDGKLDEDIEVQCLHCDEKFMLSEAKFDGLLWCKNYPKCDGAGLKWDLWPTHPKEGEKSLAPCLRK